MCMHHPTTHRPMNDDTASSSVAQAISNALTPNSPNDVLAPAHNSQTTESSAPPVLVKKTRRKLWELPHKLHCPVIGTCLDADELRRIARNTGVKPNGPLSDYDVHVSFVSAADDKNQLSLAAHKALEKKFGAHIRRFSKAKDRDQLESLWDDALGNGDVPGAFWASLTHPKCDLELNAKLYEEVHMLSHQIGAGQRADLKRLSTTQSALTKLQQELDVERKRTKKQIKDQEQRNLDLSTKLRATHEQNHSLTATNAELQRKLKHFEAQHNGEQIAALEDELREQARALAQMTAERDQWRNRCAELEINCQTSRTKEIDIDISSEDPTGSCYDCGDCPNLKGQRILCVGGRRRLIEQYRELVMRNNGRFEHHDGGIEDSRQRLDAMLSSADAIVCATDSVSHDAYYRLKRFCKRYEKPHAFLKSSGISTFAQALGNVAESASPG